MVSHYVRQMMGPIDTWDKGMLDLSRCVMCCAGSKSRFK